MMQLNREQFLEDGYAVLRQVVPPDHLVALREAAETMVERQRAIWARERAPDDPPGGVWETTAQPRLQASRTVVLVDKDTAPVVDFWCHDNTHGVSARLLDMPHAGNSEMMMMCSPQRDHGPALWHRDIHPFDTAPLQGYIEDILENGPRYVQWNIPLYDDSVLWVVPGSHVRYNTEAEQAQLDTDPRVPLPGAVQTHLAAGDGVVYITPILHWGSNYSTAMRRTLHGGFSNFTRYRNLRFLEHVDAPTRSLFKQWEANSRRSQDATERTLRAAIAGDAGAYLDGLDSMQTGLGEKGKWMLTVHLSKAACFIAIRSDPDFQASTPNLHQTAENAHPITVNWGPEFAERFTPVEAEALWDRFEPLDRALQTEEHYVASFQGSAVPYDFNHLPTDMDLGSFLAGWSA